MALWNKYKPYYGNPSDGISQSSVPARGRSVETFLGDMPYVYTWHNLEEFLAEFAKPVPKDREPIPAHKQQLLRGTFRKLRLGWASPEMKEKLKEFAELYQFIKATVNSKLPKVEYKPKVVGSRANIAGIVVGDPRTAIGRKQAVDADKRRAKSNLVRLCCNVDAFAGVGIKYFFIRGAAMCALAEALEAAKFRVEITIAIASIPLADPVKVLRKSDKAEFFNWNTHYGWDSAGTPKKGDKDAIQRIRERNQRYFIKIKPFAIPVAPLQIAFAMMHPAVLRTLFFTWWHHYLSNEKGEQQRWYQEGSGAVGVVPEGYDGTYDVYVAGFDPNNPASTYSTKEGAVEWILATLKDFGITTSK